MRKTVLGLLMGVGLFLSFSGPVMAATLAGAPVTVAGLDGDYFCNVANISDRKTIKVLIKVFGQSGNLVTSISTDIGPNQAIPLSVDLSFVNDFSLHCTVSFIGFKRNIRASQGMRGTVRDYWMNNLH